MLMIDDTEERLTSEFRIYDLSSANHRVLQVVTILSLAIGHRCFPIGRLDLKIRIGINFDTHFA